MADFTNICIGIQARSSSSRLPRKSFELIEGRPMTQWVIDACKSAAKYVNGYQQRNRQVVSVALLVPRGDELAEYYKKKLMVIEGPEDNVLERYNMMSVRLGADYIVRVTADCPLIPPYLISSHIKVAVKNSYDYTSNVHEELRTAIDGHDCEVFSKRLLEYTVQNAKEQADKEHVTTFMRRSPPGWATKGAIQNYLYLTDRKLSVDTYEDLELVRKEAAALRNARQKAEAIYGSQHIHML